MRFFEEVVSTVIGAVGMPVDAAFLIADPSVARGGEGIVSDVLHVPRLAWPISPIEADQIVGDLLARARRTARCRRPCWRRLIHISASINGAWLVRNRGAATRIRRQEQYARSLRGTLDNLCTK